MHWHRMCMQERRNSTLADVASLAEGCRLRPVSEHTGQNSHLSEFFRIWLPSAKEFWQVWILNSDECREFFRIRLPSLKEFWQVRMLNSEKCERIMTSENPDKCAHSQALMRPSKKCPPRTPVWVMRRNGAATILGGQKTSQKWVPMAFGEEGAVMLMPRSSSAPSSVRLRLGLAAAVVAA